MSCCAFYSGSNAQTIITIAGTGTSGYSGDGGPATSADIHNSLYGGVAVDAAGNKYISDYGNSLIRKVNNLGVITTFAGVYGYAGTTGDGGPATAALIAGPIGIAVDGSGNVYITGYSTNVIRKVNSAGIISTIAGTGVAGYSGDGGPATAAQLNQAWGVGADYLGNVYIADNDNHCVRKINTSGVISTYAGTGVSGYSGDGGPASAAQLRNPVGLAVDRYRNVFIADLNDGRIRKIDTSGIITTVAGNGIGGFSGDGGPATTARLYNSSGVAVDTSGNFWIADSYNNRIRKVNSSGIITTVAGTGPTGSGTGSYGGDGGVATAAYLHYPYSVAVDGFGALYISDNYNERIRMVSGNNRPPMFTGGVSQTTITCAAALDTISALLAVQDSDIGQIETWSLLSAPSHGTASPVSIAISTGGVVTPGVFTYVSTPGYSGLDTFRVSVTDGGLSDTIAIYVTVRPTPGAITGPSVVCAGYTITLADTSAGGVWSSGSTGIASVGSLTGLVTGVSGGVAPISYTNTYGCSAVATVNVTTTVPTLTGLSTVCVGLSTPLTASTTGGIWTSGSTSVATVGSSSGIVSGITSGVAVITYTLGGSCIATRSMTVNPSPAPITGLMYLCVSNIIGLGDVTTGGTWSSVNTAIGTVGSLSGIVTGIAPGVDTIRYTTTNGCYAIASITVNPLPLISPFTSVYAGSTTTLTSYSGAGTWFSSSPSIATVGSLTGVVTGVSAGVVTITLYATGCMNTLMMNVVPPQMPQIITTIAGIGTAGYAGDGGAATSAQINEPYDARMDAAGNIYIADYSNHRIRKITTTGVITTIAGTGTAGFSGDGAAATGAQLNHPASLFIDGSGNVYVGDMSNQRIRVINSAGVISTVAGSGTAGYSGDGSLATSAKLNNPCGVFVDAAGNIYIADQSNSRIRKVNVSGIISTIAGTGISGYSGDGGQATAAKLNFPKYLYIDAIGCIYISDNSNNRIRQVDPFGVIRTYAGTGIGGYLGDGSPATAARLYYPAGITFDAFGNCYIADASNNRIRKVSSAGTIFTVAGTGVSGFQGDGCAPTAARINQPNNVSVSSTGDFYITDYYNHRIRKFTNDRAPLLTNGHHQSATICSGDTLVINTQLAAIDSDIGSDITWGVTLVPAHGIVAATYTGSSSGTVITPTGRYYIPTYGYSGTDSFRIRVTDCAGMWDSTTIVVTVNPPPSVITGSGSICTGVSITLSDTLTGGAWTSGSPSVAAIGSLSGVVTGISAGVATITYTLPTGCRTTTTVTVNTPPLPITGTSTTCIGSTTILYDVGSGVWSSGSPGIATIGSSSGIVTGVTAGYAMVTYSVGIGCYTTFPVMVFPVPLPITGTANICSGTTTTLSDAVPGGYWTSGTMGVATIGSATGVVAGIAGGTSTVTYSVAPGTGCSSYRIVTVNAMPMPISGAGNVCIGNTITLVDYGGGSWSSASPSVASIGSSSGVVTGLSLGTSVITYTMPSGCFTTTVATVNPFPLPISGATHLCVLTTTTLSDPTPGGTWASSNPFIADVDMSSGTVTSLSVGVAIITYTLSTGCFVVRAITVDPTPGAITGAMGVCIGSTTLLSNPVPGGTWTSGSPLIAAIGSSSGMVSGLTAGTSLISYSLGGACMVTATVTVNMLPTTIVGPSVVCVGSSITLVDGVPGGTWSSSSGSVSVGSSSGAVMGVSAGAAVITYTLPTGCFVTKSILVNPLPGPISGTPGICLGSTTTFTSPTPGGTWVSSSTAVVTIGSSSGIATGFTTGTATIIYSLSTGCANSIVVTVNPLPALVAGITTVCEGSTILLTDATPGGIWSSGSTNAFVGSSSGIVTGVSAGTAIITYMLGSGCFRTLPVTVNPLPTPISGPSAVCVGATITETSSGSGIWISGTTSVATIGSSSGVVTGIVTGTTLITYTLTTGCRVTRTVTVSVSPTAITGPSIVCVGASVPMSDSLPGGLWTSSSAGVSIGSLTGVVTGVTAGAVTISYSFGAGCTVMRAMTVNPSPAGISGSPVLCTGTSVTMSDITPGGIWSSTNPSAAMIGSSSGVITCIAVGTATIAYTVLSTGCAAELPVTVNATPLPITGLSNVCAGATIIQSDPIPGGIWMSGTPGIATIGSASGVVTGISTGSVVITYATGSTMSSPGCRVTRTLTVAPSATVTGATGMCIGTSTLLSASLPGGTWSSALPGIATVSSGVVSGVSFGTSAITYTLPSGCMTITTVTVNSGPAPISGAPYVCAGSTTTLTDAAGGGTWISGSTGVAIIGSTTGVVFGLSAGTTVITYSLGTGCTITMTFTVDPVPGLISGSTSVCAGSSITLTDATPGGTWTSGAIGIAFVGSSGIVTGVSAGVATITYTMPSGCTAIKTITVNTTPLPITGPAHVCIGSVITLADATGGGTWSTGSTGVVLVGSAGTVTGLSAGTGIITYALSTGCSTMASVTVDPVPVGIVGTPSICIGMSSMFTDATAGGVWSSSNATIATVSIGSGIVSGASAGTATITYMMSSGCFALKPVTVNPVPSAITGVATVCVDATTTLSDAAPGGVWSSSSTSTATIGSTGVVTGISPGTAIITYMAGAGCMATRTVTVIALPAPIAGIASICVGSTTLLTDATSGGAWSSSSPSIGPVSSTGLVNGLAAGTASISYASTSGCSVIRVVTVNPIPVAIAGPPTVCIGTTVTLTDATTGGTWSSSNPTVAPIGSTSGIVSGISLGTSNITYTSAAGCRITRTITVNPLPPGITGSTNVCAGQTITLSDPASGGYWSSSNTLLATVASTSGVVTGVSGGSVTISYTLPSTGCSATFMVSVNAVPPLTGLTNLCAWGDTVTVHDANPSGSYSSTLVTILNLGSGNGRITANAPGTGTVTYTLTSGCSITVTLTINPLPAAITGVMHACVGASTALHESTTGGVWSSGSTAIATVGSASGIVTGISAGNAFITYSLPTGCKVDTVVHIDAAPGGITAMSSTVIIGSSNLFTAPMPGGTWSSSAPAIATVGSSSGIVYGVALGVATISYTLGSGCASTRMVTVVPLVSVHPDDMVGVFPNPNKGEFTVRGMVGIRTSAMQADDVSGNVWIEMTDMMGRTILRRKADIDNGNINERIVLPADLANGMYLLNARSDQFSRVFHVMIER